MTLDFNMEGDRTIMTFQNDLKFAPALYTDMKLDVTHSQTSTDFNHAGSLELTCSKGAKKLVWNAGSNHYMCETGMTFTMLGQQKFTFAHKVGSYAVLCVALASYAIPVSLLMTLNLTLYV